MSKNGNLKIFISSGTKKKSINDNIKSKKNELTNNLSDKYSKLNDFSKIKESKEVNNKNKSSFLDIYSNTKDKNNKDLIIQKEENVIEEDLIRHSKNLSNTNEKKIYNINNIFNNEKKLKKNISNFNNNNNHNNELFNINNNNKEVIKNKIKNKNLNKNQINNTFSKNTYYEKNNKKYQKKISINNDNKIEKILCKQIKSNILNKEDLISFMSSNKKKNIINSFNNYISTNPNNKNLENFSINTKSFINCHSEMKGNISNNKKYEKSCPKFNLNKKKENIFFQNTANIKQVNYEKIIEDNNDEIEENLNYKKPSLEILESIKGNLLPYYNSTAENYSEINNNSNSKTDLGINKKVPQKTKKEKQNNVINFFFPNKEKNKNSNKGETSQIGNLQNIIMKNEDNSIKLRVSTQTNNNKDNAKLKNNKNNLKESKMNNKTMGLRKIRAINDKGENHSKKDLTVNNNVTLKKRRPRYFDSEINSHIIDTTNILGNNFKNKNSYLNLIRKAFNNKNKSYYINFMSNNNNKNDNNINELITKNNNKIGNNAFVHNSVRDSKSLNVIRNRNNNFGNEINLKKLTNINEPYINNIQKITENNEKNRNYSANKNYNESNSLSNIVNNIEKSNSSKNNIDENKIYENIENNSINTYSIFIFQRYHKNFKKIALKKIKIFDINNNEILIMFYQTNADYDNGTLFNTMMTNKNLLNEKNNFRDELLNNNIPFMTKTNKDINIYFHINSNKSNYIKNIQIINYNSKISSEISPVRNIEIFKGQKLIYKGILNDDSNIIPISNQNINKGYNKLNYIENIYQLRPFSTSKIRTQNNINNEIIPQLNNNKFNNNKIEDFHTARNNLFKRLNDNENNNVVEEDYNENNNIFSKTDIMKKKDNNIKDNNNGNNTINIHINNNTNNITNLEIFEKKEKIEKEKNSYYYTMQNQPLKNNIESPIINEENENNFNDNLKLFMNFNNKKSDIIFDKTNSENYNNETDAIEENKIQINNQNIKEINYNDDNSIKINSEEHLLYSNNILNNAFNSYNISNINYICFNKIKFIITSNYGHKKHVGLTGIEFFNIRGDLINIETAISIGALPKDLRTIYDDETDNRIFENVFNGINNTDDVENMWVTKFKKSEPRTFIELYFKDKIKISKLKIYNYNEKNNLHIGVKTINLYLDDNYYGTIYLRPGVGEIAHDSIKINKENDKNKYDENDSEDGSNYNEDDFGQIITFPIKPTKENKDYKFGIKHASFLYEQSYETPFMPCGYYIKFQFLSNYYKGIAPRDEAHPFKYKDIGLDSIEIYNNENINILLNKDIFKYKIISNREFHNKKSKLIINGAQKEDGNNCIFYLFEEPIHISYIKFNPLTKYNKPLLNSVKEIKIYCESRIIFEGNLYLEHPTVALFTCDTKIKKNIDDKFLTNKLVARDIIEIKNDRYVSLILN